MTEYERQLKIDTLCLQFQTEKSPAKRRIMWAEIKSLIKGRSKETVEKLEREKGLRQ